MPDGEIDSRFSDPEASATPWDKARGQLEDARTYWFGTVRADGRPHVTTVAAVWLDEAIHVVTGQGEQKAMNIAAGNRDIVVVTGCNGWDGLDLVIEGEAVEVTDPDLLRRVADAFERKYDDFFALRLVDGHLKAEGVDDPSITFQVRATKALGFAKGERFSQTRWRFGDGDG
jgi:Pyridoxamine 5'-phosphate oxidase